MPLAFRVNGKPVTVASGTDSPLLWFLRDDLGLPGTKFGCGAGICGACTLHVDGKPERACMVDLRSLAGRSVVTIEGLSTSGLHAVQQAWLEEDVAQCGYCQPGQIMAAAGLLQGNPRPSDADIDEAMSGVICRCGTYQRIRAAIHHAARLLRRQT